MLDDEYAAQRPTALANGLSNGGAGNPYAEGERPRPERAPSPSIHYIRTENGDSVGLKELRSTNGRFRLVVLDDGSLVLYMGSDAIWAVWAVHSELVWAPKSVDPNTRLVLGNDGNLLIVRDGRWITWSSKSACGAPGPFTLAMQDDGNCILFDGDWTVRWATKTSGWYDPETQRSGSSPSV